MQRSSSRSKFVFAFALTIAVWGVAPFAQALMARREPEERPDKKPETVWEDRELPRPPEDGELPKPPEDRQMPQPPEDRENGHSGPWIRPALFQNGSHSGSTLLKPIGFFPSYGSNHFVPSVIKPPPPETIQKKPWKKPPRMRRWKWEKRED